VTSALKLLDFALEGAISESLTDHRLDLGRLLAWKILQGKLRPRDARRSLRNVDWQKVHDARAFARREKDPVRRMSLLESLPTWLVARMFSELGEARTQELARAFNSRAPQAIRANSLKLDRDKLAMKLLEERVSTRSASLAQSGLIIPRQCNLFRLRAFHEGLFEVQDEGSQLVGELVDPPQGGVIVDACAGAGGKTLQIAAALGGRGQVIAADLPSARSRLEQLRRRARRAGLQNIQIAETAAEGPLSPTLSRLTGRVPRVIVDAPCSGTGVLRRKPETRWRIEESDIDRLAALQGAILERFAPLVAPGGRLIYATCSILRAENEEVVEGFLANHPDFKVRPLSKCLGLKKADRCSDGTYLRIFPDVQDTDGFFAAVIERTG